jgi:hypothetical protein
VSYPANLRLSFQNMDEAQFIEMARRAGPSAHAVAEPARR